MNQPNTKQLTRALLALLAGLSLVACDAVPTEQTAQTSQNPSLAYAGPPCGEGIDDPTMKADACTFKVEFWDKMDSTPCINCHDGTDAAPHFLHQDNVNTAYSETIAAPIVNLVDPESSRIIEQIRNQHRQVCTSQADCNALATIVLGYIANWAAGGAGDTGGVSNEIVLEAPAIKSAGQSKSWPTDRGNFDTTVLPLLQANCAACHKESATVPQAPFFAESDPAKAYDAIKTSQKINLDDPASSRLVVRLREEFHNCWDPQNTGSTNCSDSADAMRDAIVAFVNPIPLSSVDSNWIVSKALNITTDGIVASGGKRDDSSTIALYQFKSGTGNTVYDTSGVEPALNLTLSGTEGIDYKWVGGWGVEFIGGRALGGVSESRKLRDHIVATGEYSIEAWVVPANITQGEAGDPARIITYSGGPDRRNFTLGQAEYRYEFMNRTANSTPDPNGEPSFITDDDDEDLKATQHHVVVTYSLTNGRKVYVNGIDVSTTGNADADTVEPGSLTNWADNFSLIFGSEAGGGDAWAGKLRLVAIHKRALTPAQIQQNFDAGVGEKFFMLFSVSEQMGGDCLVAGVHQCFIYFTVSQFDDYSYLFIKPTFISLNSAFTPNDTIIKGMRIGLNGKEPAVGQAYRKLDTTINTTDYVAGTGQSLSNIGTIIALEKGADADEFFLTFEQLGSTTNVRVEACTATTPCPAATPADGEPASDVGLRTFDEINATMAAITGVDPLTSAVNTTFTTIKQQLPTVEDINTFLSAQQMAIAQLAIQYCDALVEDGTKRTSFFGSFGFTQDVATAFGSGDSAAKNQIVDALYDKMAGYPDISSVTLANMPTRAEFKAELIGNPDPAASGHPGNLFDRLGLIMQQICSSSDPAINQKCDNSQVRTRAIVKAMCTATLGSAAMLIQ